MKVARLPFVTPASRGLLSSSSARGTRALQTLCYNAFALLFCALLLAGPVYASEFHLEKQKFKFSFEYESFIDAFRNEVITPGLKANYLFKGKGKLGDLALYQIEYQTGAKTNLETSFQSGELAAFLWSNRLNSSMTIPFGKCYAAAIFSCATNSYQNRPISLWTYLEGLDFWIQKEAFTLASSLFRIGK